MRFDHVKVVTRDVSALADFYERALECRPLSPVMDLADDALIRGLGAKASAIRIAWLGMPGHDPEGPRLELYQLPDEAEAARWGYLPGQGQLSFQVDDVETAAEGVVVAGGSFLGETVDWKTPSGKTARFVYLRDPEGNIVDLWSRQ
ncbi:MAG: VOC family protein [Acidimicrobiia bacterium]